MFLTFRKYLEFYYRYEIELRKMINKAEQNTTQK